MSSFVMLIELISYNPTNLSVDTSCSIISITPTTGLIKSLNYVTVTGSGFQVSGSSNSNSVLWIFDTQITSRTVAKATIISDTSLRWNFPQNKDIFTFNLYISKTPGTMWDSSSLASNTVTLFYPPKVHSINVDSTLYSNSKLEQVLNFEGFHFSSFGIFDYWVNWNGYSSTPKIVSSDDKNAQATVSKISLSTSQNKWNIVPCSDPSLSMISSFSLISMHFDGVDIYMSTLSYRIDKLIVNNLVSFWTLTLHKNSSDITGTVIDINNQQWSSLATDYISLNSFANIAAYYENNTLFTQTAPIFTTNIRINVTNDQMLSYLYGANWYCILNNTKRLSFVDVLWKLQDLNPYYKFSINATNPIVYPGSIIKSTSQSKRSDAISMVFSDVESFSSVATWSWTYSINSLDWSVWITSVSNYGKSFLLSLIDSNSRRVDDGQEKFVQFYQFPAVNALKLYSRAHLVNGSYPVYPEFEFVQVTLDNPNNIDMQILTTRWRTYRLKIEMNITYISSSTLIWKTITALNIDDFCVQISFDNGINWSSDWTTQSSVLQREIDQILWKSQTFYREDNQLSVPFNLVWFWSVDSNQNEIWVNVEEEIVWTNPLYSIYLTSQIFSTFSVPDANWNINVADGDFSFYLNLHNVIWAIPDKILASGQRNNLKIFGSNLKEITTCKFEIETGDIFTTTAISRDLSYAECQLPDFSSIVFTKPMLSVLVGLPQSDGTLSNSAKIKIYLLQNPSITSISPTKGFAAQMQDIIITGTNFYNLDSLHVKAIFTGYEKDMLIDWLAFSNEVVIIKAPNALNIQLYNDRKMFLYVSTNGIDYTQEQIYYTYLDEPSIIGLSKDEADYQGNIEIEIYGLHLTEDVTKWAFGNIYVPATFNSTSKSAICTVPPRDIYGNVQMKLVFYDTYEVNNTLVYFTYK